MRGARTRGSAQWYVLGLALSDNLVVWDTCICAIKVQHILIELHGLTSILQSICVLPVRLSVARSSGRFLRVGDRRLDRGLQCSGPESITSSPDGGKSPVVLGDQAIAIAEAPFVQCEVEIDTAIKTNWEKSGLGENSRLSFSPLFLFVVSSRGCY